MKDKIKIYQKWWFWVIVLLIVAIIGITKIFVMAFDLLKTADLEKEVKEIYKDATLYSSITTETIFLELHNFNTEDNMPQLNKINKLIKSKIESGKLVGFNKIITTGYINSNGKNEVLITKTIDNLPDFIKQEEIRYINFEEYKEVCNTLNEVMDGYTDLFKSVY